MESVLLNAIYGDWTHDRGQAGSCRTREEAPTQAAEGDLYHLQQREANRSTALPRRPSWCIGQRVVGNSLVMLNSDLLLSFSQLCGSLDLLNPQGCKFHSRKPAGFSGAFPLSGCVRCLWVSFSTYQGSESVNELLGVLHGWVGSPRAECSSSTLTACRWVCGIQESWAPSAPTPQQDQADPGRSRPDCS